MQTEIAEYLSAGWALCKIKSGDKGAFEDGWNTRGGAYQGDRGAALDRWTAGVGLLHAYSGTCAVDIDDIKKALPAFAEQGIDLAALLRAPGAFVWTSGRVGRAKLLFACPEPLLTCARHQHGFELRCATKAGLSTQDVLPPTIHPDTGKPFRWMARGTNLRDLPALPPELRRAWPRAEALWPETAPAMGPRSAPAGVSSLTAAAMVGMADTAAEGQRNDFLSKALFRHLKQGGDYESSLEWLREFNVKNCDPPEDDDKLVKIWRNKDRVEPDPVVIPASLPGAEPLVFETRPDLPFSYLWDGDWVYQTPPGGGANKLIYKGPLWCARILRTRHPDGSEERTLDLNTHAGQKMIPAGALITATDKTLVNHGLYAVDEGAKTVRRYLIACMQDCETKGLIVDTYNTFGWHDDGFVVGSTLFRPHVPPAAIALTPALRPMAEGMGPAPQGSLEAWRSAALDMVQPFNMPQAFAFLMGMAAPLMKLSGERGGMYSLLGESGQGKSSVQNAICTVWGDPVQFHTRADDTANARMIKLSYLSNLPMVAEELTKMEPLELNNLAYSVSEGRDKDRGTQEGGLRLNVGQWHTLVISSSNRSLLDAILMNDGDAAAYRILEDTITLPRGAKSSEGDRIMRALAANQGHAGYIFAQYLVDNRERVTHYIRKLAQELAQEVRASTKERIRINMLACALVAAACLKACGVLPLEFRAFRDYAVDVLHRNMGSQAEAAVGLGDVLQEFIDKNQASVLRMTNGNPTNVTSIQGRTAPIIMRYDTDLEELTINKKALHAYVLDRKQSWAGFKDWLANTGFLKREQKVILTRGSGLPATPQAAVVILDNSRMKALDVDTDTRTALTAAAAV
jgi:Domain of unknown function (DUF927)/Bifunctional DNA primase/polymerase, N-terminal